MPTNKKKVQTYGTSWRHLISEAIMSLYDRDFRFVFNRVVGDNPLET